MKAELNAVLDEELNGLPERWRRVLVMCHLQGMTAEAAARSLGCARGTVLSRLHRGRTRLKERLVRRGIAFAAITGWMTGSNAVLAVLPIRWVERTLVTISSVDGSASAATILAQGVMNAMWMRTLQTCAATALSVAVFVSAVVMGVASSEAEAGGQAVPTPPAKGPVKAAPPAPPPKLFEPGGGKAPVAPIGKVDAKKELAKFQGE